MDRAKQIWEDLGETDAYFAVATFEEYRKGNLDQAAKERFFQSGRGHVEGLWSEIERGFGIEFKPAMGLDYGCGVGRVLIALAEKCGNVKGVDISQSMLDETRKNLAERGLKNVELQNADEFLLADGDSYDFVHSYIVLQHVDPKIGTEIVRKMVEQLTTDGVGMVHVTFFDNADAGTKLRSRVYRDVPLVHDLISAIRGKRSDFMPMYEYDLGVIFGILKGNGCDEVFVRFTDHGFSGAMIFFRKSEH